MLMGNDGRYPVEGISALYGVEGVMLDKQWDEYWERFAQRREEYRESFKPEYPGTVFSMGAYSQSLLADVAPSDILAVTLRRGGEEKHFNSEDSPTPAEIYSALSAIRVTGPAVDDASGEAFTLTLVYLNLNDGGFYDYVDFHFMYGGYIGDDVVYAVEGVDALLAATE